MPCYKPLKAWYALYKNPNGRRSVVFDQTKSNGNPVTLPCGQCIGCRLEYSRQWAMRCVHEAESWDENCFITLTYAPEHLPIDGSLQLDHFQKFIKRLRKKYVPTNPYNQKLEKTKYENFRKKNGIRFFMCGEYGEQCHHCTQNKFACKCKKFEPTLGRPHYHACLFNFNFTDRTLYKNANGVSLYRSEILESLWPYGFATIGDVTFESAAYVARYVVKKINGDIAENHYLKTDSLTGETHPIKPEYTTMSRRPGIGKYFYDQFKGDFDKDYITLRGIKMKPAKYYDNQLRIESEAQYENMKKLRKQKIKEHADDCTPERLAVRHKLQQIIHDKHLQRGLHHEN